MRNQSKVVIPIILLALLVLLIAFIQTKTQKISLQPSSSSITKSKPLPSPDASGWVSYSGVHLPIAFKYSQDWFVSETNQVLGNSKYEIDIRNYSVNTNTPQPKNPFAYTIYKWSELNQQIKTASELKTYLQNQDKQKAAGACYFGEATAGKFTALNVQVLTNGNIQILSRQTKCALSNDSISYEFYFLNGSGNVYLLASNPNVGKRASTIDEKKLVNSLQF